MKVYKNKFLLAVSLALAVLFLIVPKISWAADGGLFSLAIDSVWDIVLGLVSLVVDLFGSFIITAAASVVSYVFSFQSFATVPVVQIGWTISRDLANMFFILIMLLIAFGTVLRIETYGWKKLIPKLVTAALLINFSLIICASVIDFGNSLSRFFISGGNTKKELDVGASILSSLRAGTIAQLRNNVSGESPITSLIMASIGQLIMYIVIAFLLLAFAGVMISRLIKLWILIIVSPLAWVSSALPGISGIGVSNQFSTWWKKFFDLAVFFPVSISFFLMLGLITGATFNAVGYQGINDVKSAGGFWEAIFPSTTFSVIMQFIIVIGILWYGLDQAQKSGTYGGKLVVGWAQKGRAWAEGKVKSGVKALPGTAVKLADRKTGGAASRFVSGAFEKLEKAPIIGRGVMGGPGAYAARQKKVLEEEKGKISKLRPQDLKAIVDQAAVTPQGMARRAAAISLLAEKNQLDDSHIKYLQSYATAGGNMKDVLEHRLDWAFNEDVQKTMAQASGPDQSRWLQITQQTGATRENLTRELIRDKLIPTKTEDFAKIQKQAVTGGPGTTAEKIKELIAEQLGDQGKLYGNSLNALANKNEESYHQLIQYLSQPNVLNSLKQSVRQNILGTPSAQTLGTVPAPPPAQP